jgi:putative ABC transport system permease protein
VARALADQDAAPHVKSVSPEVTAQATATYEGASHDLGQLLGTYPSYFEASNSPVSTGTYFTNDDVLNARKVVVLGQSVVDSLFGDVDPIGKRISIDGILFQVVGVLEDKGRPASGRERRCDRAALDAAADPDGLRALSRSSCSHSAEDVDAAEAEITRC